MYSFSLYKSFASFNSVFGSKFSFSSIDDVSETKSSFESETKKSFSFELFVYAEGLVFLSSESVSILGVSEDLFSDDEAESEFVC